MDSYGLIKMHRELDLYLWNIEGTSKPDQSDLCLNNENYLFAISVLTLQYTTTKKFDDILFLTIFVVQKSNLQRVRRGINFMFISIKGAKENNLKNIDLQIPKNKLIVFTGLSGSGKSTLALETLQRECQRQYMESMGLTMDIGGKPKVDSIEGLSSVISINQHHTNSNPRSTVGTVTEISAYLRVLYAKLGERPCPHCGKIITQDYDETAFAVYTEMPDQEPGGTELYERMIACPHCGEQTLRLRNGH